MRPDATGKTPKPNPLFASHVGGQKVFLDLAVQGEVTHNWVLGRSAQMAHVLVDMGAVTGDRIAVHVEKAPEMRMLYAACV